MFILTSDWVYTVIGVVLLHWLLPEKLRGWWIVTASAGFLAWLNPVSLGLLAGYTGVTYAVAGRKDHISGKTLVGLIVLMVAVLSAFKLHMAIADRPVIDLDPLTEDYIIPLGLSYYAFRAIHYAIEKYKGTIPAHDFKSFAQYMFFLPTFLAGPIHRFPAFYKDLQRKRWNAFMFAEGLERMLIGYVKIAFLANLVVNNLIGVVVMNVEGAHPHLGAYIDMIKNALNLYFQFSGYTDVAIGFGLLIGFRVMENFNFPFLARNISDFWQRWHMSLTSWCRDYVYMGIVSTTRQAWLGAVSAMLVMGLWHEFSLRFVCWGVFHGVGIMIWQQFQKLKPHLPHTDNRFAAGAWRIFSTLLTLHYFMFGSLLAIYPTPASAVEEWARILLFWQ
jgi:alginate O-acetyltransferase complex protein AlgI